MIASDIIPFHVQGPDDGVPVLLIHPLGADHSVWDETRDSFDLNIRSISVNLRGAAGTPLPAAPVTLEQTVFDIEAVRSALDLKSMVLVGCAVGAMAAAAYTARHPQHVAGMLLSNPAIEITEAAGVNLKMRAEAVRRGGMTALLPDAIENAFRGYLETGRRRDYEARFIAQPAEGYALAVLGVVGASVAQDLDTIACPVRLLAGGQDILLPVAQAEKCMARLHACELVTLERGAHFMPYQEPEWFADQLNLFVRYLGKS
ncbi:alpha/beta fold hydrolase [Rhizobium lusitanum]|nr:alpha/beta hydrolase [Rhizobium lusitanum]